MGSSGFVMDGKTLARYTGRDSRVVVPDGVRRIGYEAFRDCDALEHIVIPKSVEEIEGRAFLDCAELESAELHKGLESIGYEAFQGCSSLREVTIPESVRSVGTEAFQGCSRLERAVLPGRMRYVPEGMFYGCSRLQSVDLPRGAEVIGDWAFKGCRRLQKVLLPGGLERIHDEAFAGTGLKSVKLPWRLDYLSDSAFEYDVEVRKGCPGFNFAEKGHPDAMMLEEIRGHAIHPDGLAWFPAREANGAAGMDGTFSLDNMCRCLRCGRNAGTVTMDDYSIVSDICYYMKRHLKSDGLSDGQEAIDRFWEQYREFELEQEAKEARKPVICTLRFPDGDIEYRTQAWLRRGLADYRGYEGPEAGSLSMAVPCGLPEEDLRKVYEAMREARMPDLGSYGQWKEGARGTSMDPRRSLASRKEAPDRAWRSPESGAARAAEDAARKAGKPVIGILKRPLGDVGYRTREGIAYGLSSCFDEAGKFDKNSGVRLMLANGLTDGQLREVYGGICDAKGVPASDFEGWRRTRIKPAPKSGHEPPDTSAIERNAAGSVGEKAIY